MKKRPGLAHFFKKKLHSAVKIEAKCSWCTTSFTVFHFRLLDGSPGLVVMRDDSCSRGRGFESRRRILTYQFARLGNAYDST